MHLLKGKEPSTPQKMQSLLLKLSPESSLALPLAASLVFNALLLLALLHRCSSKAPRATKPATAQALSPKPAQRPKKQTRQPPDVSDPVAAVEKLRALNADFKYLEAGELLDALQLALSGDGHGSSATWSIGAQWSKDEARQQLNELLNSSSLEERISTARAAVKDLNNDQGFDLIQEDPTMKVLQRLTPDRVLTVKIEAVLEGVSPAQCIMIWREAALYPEWFPFVTGGKTLGDIHPGDTIVHILVETFFMSVDMVLWGWACDNLSEGELLMCVRPVRSSTKRPPGVPYPPPGGGARRQTVFGALRAHAVIDILVEPLGDRSVRFAFQMSDQLPSFMPSWAINYVVQNAMVDIFRKMSEVATQMAKGDPASKHLQHINRPAYAPTREWIEERLGK